MLELTKKGFTREKAYKIGAKKCYDGMEKINESFIIVA